MAATGPPRHVPTAWGSGNQSMNGNSARLPFAVSPVSDDDDDSLPASPPKTVGRLRGGPIDMASDEDMDVDGDDDSLPASPTATPPLDDPMMDPPDLGAPKPIAPIVAAAATAPAVRNPLPPPTIAVPRTRMEPQPRPAVATTQRTEQQQQQQPRPPRTSQTSSSWAVPAPAPAPMAAARRPDPSVSTATRRLDVPDESAEALKVRSPSYDQAHQAMDNAESNAQHKALTMWKGLQAHIKNMPTGKARQGCTWYNNVVKGNQIVSYVLMYLHSRPEEKYKQASRHQAVGIAQMLADQSMLIPANDHANDGISDSPKCFFYLSGIAAEGAVGLIR
eukprot:m.168947 g.168947  ORF g.168947 m.168947 type:complete len:334 (+) comp13029_c0_seq1:77-1078(+)